RRPREMLDHLARRRSVLGQRTAQGGAKLLDRGGGTDPPLGQALQELDGEIGGALQQTGMIHVILLDSSSCRGAWEQGGHIGPPLQTTWIEINPRTHDAPESGRPQNDL